MSKKTRTKNETEDCYVEKRGVMSGGMSGGSKIFIIPPFVFRWAIVSVSEAAHANESMTGQRSQGWVRTTNQHV